MRGGGIPTYGDGYNVLVHQQFVHPWQKVEKDQWGLQIGRKNMGISIPSGLGSLLEKSIFETCMARDPLQIQAGGASAPVSQPHLPLLGSQGCDHQSDPTHTFQAFYLKCTVPPSWGRALALSDATSPEMFLEAS